MYVSLRGLGQDNTSVEDILSTPSLTPVLPSDEQAPTYEEIDTSIPTDVSVASTPTLPVAISGPAPSAALTMSPAQSVTPIVLPNGVSVNPQALSAAQLALTPAQLQAQLYPGVLQTTGAVGTSAAGSTVPFSLSTWLTQSTVIAGLTNQTVALGGLLFGGLLAIILAKKKK